MPSYCEFAPGQPYHAAYHQQEYGFPVTEDNRLFERLVLELNQAGLSWLTILKKREHFSRAYDAFDVATVADYGEEERKRLLADAGIIRNRLKVDAAIHNARRIRQLQETSGSFYQWLVNHHPLPKADWIRLFRKTFRFTGGEITGEFLMSIGFLPGAHIESCPVYRDILSRNPAWNW